MLRSMTGFVQERYSKDNLVIFTTIKSYNSRTLDIYLKINLPYVEIEKKVLQIIREFIKRGRIECFINIFSQKNEQVEIIFNRPAIKKIEEELKDIGVTSSSLFVNLSEIPGLITINPSPSLFGSEFIKFIEDSIRKSLEKLIREREREGKEIEKEIVKMINHVEKLMGKIERREKFQVSKIKKKLEKNLKLLKNALKINDIKREEIFSILRKIDIMEEIVRSKAHIKEFKKCIEKREPVGKKMEFLALEIQREVTSILSKSEDEKISLYSVHIKDYLEKIKEQLRNIE